MPPDPTPPQWTVAIDPDAAPGDVLPALARLLLARARRRLLAQGDGVEGDTARRSGCAQENRKAGRVNGRQRTQENWIGLRQYTTRPLERQAQPDPDARRLEARCHPEVAAGLLAAMLERRPVRSWAELRAAGLDRATVLVGIAALLETGDYRIRLGPLLVEAETWPGQEVAP